MKGFRVPPQPSKKEAFHKIETELANLQMSGRISQMMTKQLMQNIKGVTDDLNAAMQQMMELQYKLDAVSKALNLDPKQIADLSNAQRLVDFNEASAKADAKENLLPANEVSEDSTVIITSKAVNAEGTDMGIFRSRIKLSESGVPEMIAALQGKQAGDVVSSKLNGLDHEIELLAVSNPSPEPASPAPTLEAAQ